MSRFTGYHENGGYAQFATVDEAYAYPIPKQLDDAEAAPLLCAGIIEYRALTRAGVTPGGRLLLVGFGSSAHVVFQIARHRGCEIFVVTRGEGHRKLARFPWCMVLTTLAHPLRHLDILRFDDLQGIPDPPDRVEKAFDVFIETYEAKHEGAVAYLKKDREALLTFYDFPAQHWRHIRTSNPIESTFATVRLRHDKTKGNGSKKACLAMVFKLAQTAQRGWRKLNGHELISDVIQGVKFVDGDKTLAA